MCGFGFPAGNIISNEDSTITIKLSNGESFTWYGEDDAGYALANGEYLVKLENADTMGVVTTVTQSVTVLRGESLVTVRIYNEAGELVWEKSVTSGVVPEMGQVSLSGDRVSPGTSTPGDDGELRIDLGGVEEVVRDGRDLEGNIVANGEYIVEVRVQTGEDDIVVTRTVTVLHGEIGLLTGVVVAPNPAIAVTSVKITAEGEGITAIRINIYNISGELVRILAAEGDSVRWYLDSAAGEAISDGVYVALVQAIDSQGTNDQRLVRIVVLR